MAKKEKKWSSLTKAKKIEWLRGAIDKILTRMPAHEPAGRIDARVLGCTGGYRCGLFP
jgi:sorbitol-specific phosphotransferase system component IIBC